MVHADHDSPAPSPAAPGFLLVIGCLGDTFSSNSSCVQRARDSEREGERKEERKEKRTDGRRTGYPRRGKLLSDSLVDESGGARARGKNTAREGARRHPFAHETPEFPAHEKPRDKTSTTHKKTGRKWSGGKRLLLNIARARNLVGRWSRLEGERDMAPTTTHLTLSTISFLFLDTRGHKGHCVFYR